MNFSQSPSMMEPNESSKPKVEDPHVSDGGNVEINARHSDVETEEDLDEKYKVGEKHNKDVPENHDQNKSTEVENETFVRVVKPENEKVQKLLDVIPDSVKRKIERYIKESRPDEVTRHIAGLGLSMSSQEELIKHFTKYLEDGIKRISWTGKRLAYAVAILEHTLESAENKNITSIKNMIRNYLIFCKVFKENEDNKLPRYGQFSYVMRTIFAGVTSKEEIDAKIKKHKTFGEKSDLTEEELDALRNAAKEVDRDMAGAKGKKREADESIIESTEEAKREKSIVWGGGMGKLKEYKFNKYTFQTNSIQDPDRIGKDTAKGRSSWEPLFVAYVDHINKKIENRISKKENISDEEKERRIRETRVELLYEKFNFPVALKVDKNGMYKATVYVLDFIDVNRWKGIEIKGPLTPEAAEKIRLFQKYYVEGDFSDLEGEEQIIMMEYVQEALDNLKDWCVKNNYPVFNQFSSLEVLGAYKWDYDLNNFNNYEEARHMKELSVKTRQQLQKGFIKLVEDRIKSGKTPDIRPEHYTLSDNLPKVEKFAKQEAKKKGEPFDLEKPAATKPYMPEIIVKDVINKRENEEFLGSNLVYVNKILETLPISPYEKEIVSSILSIIKEFTGGIYCRDSIESTKSVLGNDKYLSIVSGKEDYAFVDTDGNLEIAKWFYKYKKVLENLNKLLVFFDGLTRKNAFTEVSYGFQPKKVESLIRNFIKTEKGRFEIKKSQQILKIDASFFDIENNREKILVPLHSYCQFTLGKYYHKYEERFSEVISLTEQFLQVDENDYNIEMTEIRTRMENKERRKWNEKRYITEVVSLTCLENKIYNPYLYQPILLLFNNPAFDTIENVHSLLFNVKRLYKGDLNKASEFFSSHELSKFTKLEYLEIFEHIKKLDLGPLKISDQELKLIKIFLNSRKEVINSIVNILLFTELGSDKYNSFNSSLKSNLQKYKI